MNKLDLIIGGVQKCGTTALFEYLAQHPDFLAPSKKELHFFDNEEVDWSNPDYSVYHRFFHHVDDSKFRFEATPIYIFWPQSLARIRSYRSDIRQIFIFRDPVERAWSHWCMEYARGAETLDFHTAIRAGRRRLEKSLPNSPAWRTFSYLERGFYSSQVENVLSLFPKKNVLFLTSEQLRKRPKHTLDCITAFLGVSEFKDFSVLNKNMRTPFAYPSQFNEDDRCYLREIYARDVEKFGLISGLNVSDWLF